MDGADAVAPVPAGLWDPDSRRFALVVGHDRGGPSRQALRFAETDAERMALVLRELGNFPTQNVHLLRAPSAADIQLSLGRIETQIQAWRRSRVPGTGPGRAVLVVYFSGHSDGKVIELGGERLAHGQLMQWITGVGADLRVIIVDACRSGTLLALKGGVPAPGFGVEVGTEVSTGQAILASTGADEDALESAELGGSFFSHHLLSGLRGAADANRDGSISLNEAYAHAAARTAADTTGTVFGPQRPTYQIHLAGRGDFVLTRIPSAGTVLELPAGLDRALVIDALRGTIAAEWAPGSAPRLAVPPVPLVVRAWRAGRPLSVRLSAAYGETRRISAEELVPEPEPTASPAERQLATAPPVVRRDRDGGRTPVAERDVRRALAAPQGSCRLRCVIDGRADRADCPAPVTILAHVPPRPDVQARYTLALDLPSRSSLVRLRFEVCDPQGMWLHLADAPTCNGAGGDSGQFSNDAELELRGTGLWVWGNDYGRPGQLTDHNIVSAPGFVSVAGCSTRTLVVGDQLVRSPDPAVRARSPYGLRLDPPADHEGRPDRRWYIGVNRSVGSDRPDRVGAGVNWLEICVL